MIHSLKLLAAIALPVWGTDIVRAGVIRIFGENLRRVLASSLSNRFKVVIAGLAVMRRPDCLNPTPEAPCSA